MFRKIFLFFYFSFFSFFVFSASEDTINGIFKTTKRVIQDTSVIFSWKVNGLNDTIMNNFDTILPDFQRYNSFYRLSFSNSLIANNGQSTKSNIFDFDYNLSNEPYFIQSFLPYLLNVCNISFFNSKYPYTEGFYTNGQKKDQNLRILHTQNISSTLNFGFIYSLASNEGVFKRQKVRDNSFAFFSSLSGDRYSYHSAYIWNKLKTMTNGGLKADSIFDNSTEPTQTLDVNLSGAETNISKKTYFFSQKLNFIQQSSNVDTVEKKYKKYLFSLDHIFIFDRSSKKYLDIRTKYYSDWFHNLNLTDDSVFCNDFKNTALVNFDNSDFYRFPFRMKIGAELQTQKYGCFSYDTLIQNSNLLSSFSKETSNSFFVNALIKYYINGYQKDNYNIDISVKKHLLKNTDSLWLKFSGSIVRSKPELYLKKYSSNNFRWDNNFNLTKCTNFRLEFFSKKLDVKANFSYYIIDNYISFDLNATPSQSFDKTNIFCVYVNKNFRIGKFHFDNYIVYQRCNNFNIRLPEICTYNSIYLKIYPFNKKLPSHIGFDVNFNSSYFGYAYMPSSNIFYPQNIREFGNHPYVDFFVAVQRKMVRIFIKAEHLNSFIEKRNYYKSLHNPANGFAIRFGVSWRFSD